MEHRFVSYKQINTYPRERTTFGIAIWGRYLREATHLLNGGEVCYNF